MDSLIRFRRSTGPAGIGRRAPVRALGLALAIVLLASLLVPLATPVVADELAATEEVTPTLQDDGETQDPGEGGQGDGAAGETPAVGETPVADETPASEETPDAGLIPGDPLTSGIAVSIWVCGADYGADLQQFLAQCQPDQQITFGISGDGIFVAADVVGSFYRTGLPATTYTIRENLPGDYREPVVFCGKAPTGFEIEPAPVVTTNARYTFALGIDESIACHWFNIPQVLERGELWLYKMICPEDPRFDYFTADPSELDQRCELYGGDALAYSLYSHVSGTTDQRDINQEHAAFIWKDVPAGQVTLTELGWNAGAPLLYCSTYPGTTSWFKVDVSPDRTASIEIPADLNVACRWYAIPSGTVTVTINVHDCPAAFNAAGADIYDLAQHCDGYEDGIGFGAYTFHGGLLAEQATGDTFSNGVTFVGLPVGGDEHPAVGGLVFTEQVREGYGQPRVFCKVTDALGNQSGQQEWAVLWSDGYYGVGYYTGDTFEDHGDVAYCDWFNVPESEDLSTTDPDGGTGSTDGADTDSEEEEADADSEAETDTNSEEVTDTDGDDGSAADTENGADPSSEDNSTKDDEDDAGTDAAHDEGGTIVVNLWICPANEKGDASSPDDLYASCTAAGQGVDILLSNAVAGWQDETDDAGQVAFDGLPEGDYRLSEDRPNGNGEPIVACRLQVGHGALAYETAPERVEVGGQSESGIEIELRSGTTWTCDWFNVAGEAQPETETGESTARHRREVVVAA